MTEIELAEKVIDWLGNDGWEVYQEVQRFGYASRTVDIVAVCQPEHLKFPIVWFIECKTSFGLAVAEQADHWLRYQVAHYISVAVPPLRLRERTHVYLKNILKLDGIGIIEVSEYQSRNNYYCDETLAPRPYRPSWTRHYSRRQETLDMLTELHKTYAKAGNSDSKKLTSFGITRDAVVKHVRSYPGCTMNQLLDNIDTHYSNRATAKATIPAAIHKGWITGIKIVKEGRVIKLYPKEANINGGNNGDRGTSGIEGGYPGAE